MKNYLDIDEEKIKIVKIDSESNSVTLTSCTEDNYVFDLRSVVEIVLPKDVISIEYYLLKGKKSVNSDGRIEIIDIEDSEKNKIDKLIEHLITKFYEN